MLTSRLQPQTILICRQGTNLLNLAHINVHIALIHLHWFLLILQTRTVCEPGCVVSFLRSVRLCLCQASTSAGSSGCRTTALWCTSGTRSRMWALPTAWLASTITSCRWNRPLARIASSRCPVLSLNRPYWDDFGATVQDNVTFLFNNPLRCMRCIH